MTDFHRPVF